MSKYFSLDEFECTCGKCGLKRIDPKFLNTLDAIREDCGFPFYINSGCRCDERNEFIGGAANSPHKILEDGFTHAADIRNTSSRERYMIINSALKHGITRIGIGENFVHLDNADMLNGSPWNSDTHVANLIWTYY